MKAFIAMGQGWSDKVRMERACFAKLFASIEIPTYTNAKNPVYLTKNHIPQLKNLDGVTDLFVYSCNIDAVGGKINELLVADDVAVSKFRGRIWHLAVDTKLPLMSMYRWAQQTKRNITGLQDWVGEIHCLSQARNTAGLLEAYEPFYKRHGLRPQTIRHVPLELNVFYADRPTANVEPSYDLVYIGGDRQGKRTKILGDFMTPVKDRSAIVGNVTNKFKELYPELCVHDSVNKNGLWSAYQMGSVAIALGDKNYRELQHYTPRLYEAPIAGRVTVIDEKFMPNTVHEFPMTIWPRISSATDALQFANFKHLANLQYKQLEERKHTLISKLLYI